jgi:hypothetical protein
VTTIRIDQALFGYREGHRLLQASRKFTPTTERSLLTLTDMSGSRMVDGFEEYVSGYPVPGEECYAFVKTWYAPEMERPGCVWSHVLILRNSDLARISDSDQLLPLFRRPHDGEFDSYLSLLAPRSERLHEQVSRPDLSEAQALISALYTESDKPVIITASNAESREGIVLAIWSQQWPALRAAFRFCTGSLSARTYAGRAFDLQIIPHKLLRELQRDPNAFVTVFENGSPGRGTNPRETAPWMITAAQDLVIGKGSFRNFLRRFADGGPEQRSLYSKMGELFSFFVDFDTSPDSSKISEITRRLSESFPDAGAGVALKYALYGPVASPELHLPFIREQARLGELARTPYWNSFDAIQLQLRQRGRMFWKNDPAQGKTFLVELLDSSSNALADEIVAGLAESISVVDACEIARERPPLLLALVMRSPDIVASQEFWECKLPLQTYYGILDFLKTDKAVLVPATSWISFVIENRSNDLASAVVERFATETVSVFLERARATGKQGHWIPGQAWRSALATRQDELLVFFDREDYASSPSAMTLFAGLLDSHSPELTKRGLLPWLDLVRSGLDLVLRFPNAEASGFLLSLGFQHSEEESLELVCGCFEHVHAAARDDSPDPLSYRTWRSLESEVPALSWKRNWDRCERLRQGLLQRFIRNSWPREELLRCVSRPATLRSVLYSSREIRGGEEFIRVVAEDVLSGVSNATEPQREALQSSFRRNWRGELKLDL